MNLALTLLALAALNARTQVPEYDFDVAGWNGGHSDMNVHGVVVTTTPLAQFVWTGVVTTTSGATFLPFPTGATSCRAEGINDSGTVVGHGEWPGERRAVVWAPDGNGSYDMYTLQPLPGFSRAAAVDINNRGDIIGYCISDQSNGPVSTLFDLTGPPTNLAALGAPQNPEEINDQGVIVFSTGSHLFDIDSMSTLPLPTFPAGQTSFSGRAINDFNELAGSAFYGNMKAPVRWTQLNGWENLSDPVSSSTSHIDAQDINNRGVTMFSSPEAHVYFPLWGSTPLSDLVPGGNPLPWSFFAGPGSLINERSTIAIETIHPTVSGLSGIGFFTMLPPAGIPLCLGDGVSTGCPCGNQSIEGTDSGCTHSGGHGAWLDASGSAMVSTADLRLHVSRARPSQTAMLLQGASLISLPFRDGVLCMGSPTERVELLALDPGGAASTTVSIALEGNVAPGDTRYYQVWFRDPGGISPCGSGSNFTQALMVDWQ